MRGRGRELVLLLAATVGCDDAITSEAGRFEIAFAGVHTEELRDWAPPYRVVEGTVLCPRASCEACGGALSCDGVPVSAEGVTADGSGCFVADTPGEVTWRVGAPCDEHDHATMTVVAAGAVAAEVVLWPDRWALDAGTLHGPELAPPGSPLRVVAESRVALPVRLYTRADGRTVGWDAGEVRVTGVKGRAPVVYPGDRLAAVMFAGGAAEASVVTAGGTWSLGQVEGVAEGAATSIEVSAVSMADEGPMFARAVVRDANDAVLVGLPVTWSVEEGQLALAVDAELPGQDYVRLGDECVAPELRGGPRSAVIAARHGGLSGSLELRWEGVAGEKDPEWVAHDGCPEAGGCGCRSETASGLPALVVLLWRRRRGGRR